jgi:hypothetical protein
MCTGSVPKAKRSIEPVPSKIIHFIVSSYTIPRIATATSQQAIREFSIKHRAE